MPTLKPVNSSNNEPYLRSYTVNPLNNEPILRSYTVRVYNWDMAQSFEISIEAIRDLCGGDAVSFTQR